MKILWIISSGWEEGGAESSLVSMRPIFERQGHEIKILSSDDRPDMPHFSDVMYRTPFGKLRQLFYTINPYAYRTLKKVLREFRPDVVHVHTIGHASPVILFPLKHFPTLLTMHGPEGFVKSLLIWCFRLSDFKHGEYDQKQLRFVGKLRWLYHTYINGPLYKIGFQNVDTIISPSNYMQDLVRHDGHESIFIPNGTTLFDHRPVKLGQLTHTLVFVGRLEKFKGVEYAIRAIPAVQTRFPDTTLTIVGDGSERANLEALVRELKLTSSVIFTGRLARTELPRVYADAMIMLMPSTGVEAFGLTGIEAMSIGRPVVASTIGGISDWLLHKETGFLVPPKDHTALSEAIIALFSDPALLLTMMLNARKQAEQFSLEVHVDRIIDLYRKTIGTNEAR